MATSKKESGTHLTAAGRGKKRLMVLPEKAQSANVELSKLLASETPEVIEETTLFPSASKTDLLFACTWPWGKTVRRAEVGERTRFGSAFHEALERQLQPPAGHMSYDMFPEIAGRFDVDAEELQERVDEAFPVLHAWLVGDNMWGLNFLKAGIKTELSVGYNPATDKARLLVNGPGPKHDYPDKKPGEIPGTADVISLVTAIEHPKDGGRQKRILLVLDHKSGWNVAADWQPQTPAESGQLRTLALALATLYGADEVIVAFFHARAGSLPLVTADMLTKEDLIQHRKALKNALGNINSGWLRPGAWCAHCPAFDICPTQRSTLIELKRPPGALTSERVGAIHQAASLYDNLRDRLREEIRAWVRVNGPGLRPDGALVDLVEKEATSLSQASIRRALGPLEGPKEIERLRRLGCIETSKRLELRAVKK